MYKLFIPNETAIRTSLKGFCRNPNLKLVDKKDCIAITKHLGEFEAARFHLQF